MIGSLTRDSVMTKAVAATIRPAPQAQVASESQPNSLSPPKSVKKIRQVVAIERKMTPKMSIGFSAFLLGSFSATRAMMNAAMPTGMLM